MLLWAALTISGCEVDSGENFRFVTLRVLDAEVPESLEFVQDKTYNIKVTYERINGCVFFEGFNVEETESTTQEVYVVGTEIEDLACTQAIESGTANFEFKVQHEGTYTLRFYSGQDQNNQPVFLEYQVDMLSGP